MTEAYTPTEAAKKIGISRPMVYKLEKRGLLTRLEGHKQTFYSAASVESLKASKGSTGRIKVVSTQIQLKYA